MKTRAEWLAECPEYQPLSDFWELVHLLIFRDRHEWIDRREFADGFERRAKLDPFKEKKTKA